MFTKKTVGHMEDRFVIGTFSPSNCFRRSEKDAFIPRFSRPAPSEKSLQVNSILVDDLLISLLEENIAMYRFPFQFVH